ncbi:hypothetical protein [Cellulomonas hominis]
MPPGRRTPRFTELAAATGTTSEGNIGRLGGAIDQFISSRVDAVDPA